VTVTIRLSGPDDERDAVLAAIAAVLDVGQPSRPRPNRYDPGCPRLRRRLRHTVRRRRQARPDQTRRPVAIALGNRSNNAALPMAA
jgi:hypothetical protein